MSSLSSCKSSRNTTPPFAQLPHAQGCLWGEDYTRRLQWEWTSVTTRRRLSFFVVVFPCCKVYFYLCFQFTRVSCSWSIGHSEKSVTTPSGKTEKSRFQGSTSRVETSCQLTQDSGYVPVTSFPHPGPQSLNPPFLTGIKVVNLMLWKMPNRHDHLTQSA